LLNNFISSKGGRDESALQNNYSPSPHSKCSKIIDLFAVGEALLEKKMVGSHLGQSLLGFVFNNGDRPKKVSIATSVQ
jgi:hypothetical protein